MLLVRCASLLAVAPGRFMHSIKVVFALVLVRVIWPVGGIGGNQFLVRRVARANPTACSNGWCRRPIRTTPAHAVLFRPTGEGPFPLALIAHATTQNVLRRAQMPQPEYRALAGFLVARGFAVLVPERLGHGGTGGKYLEDQGGCDEADYSRAGRATADQITAAMNFLRRQPFIRPDRTSL